MTYKRLTRKDNERLIGIANGKEKKKKSKARKGVGRKVGQKGGITILDLLLAKMISNNNRNRVQREAMIDTMNKPQIGQMGKLVDFYLNSHTKLPTKTIKLLSKYQEFVKEITENKVPLSMKKRIFKQKGGILPMLLPFAAKAAAPLAGSPLSGVGKIILNNGFQKKSYSFLMTTITFP